MNAAAAEIEFRNREQEIDRLLERLPPRSDRSTITFLRAPSGFGKTRLVDQVLSRLDADSPRHLVVEPEIRARHRSSRVYAWYFVQRAAAATSQPAAAPPPTFSTYRKQQRLRPINWASLYETGKEAYSPSKLTKMAIELGEYLLGKNRFHPDALLKDESAFATRHARQYVEWLAGLGATLFVVRETQLIDLESFRFFLNLH